MSKHDKFIFTPITTVLEEAVTASYGIGSGIETYAVSDYIMQSLFLKMTGFQEQKLKCISWEMATNDFDFRRGLLNNEYKFSEYSNYSAKNNLFKKLQEIIQNLRVDFDIEVAITEKKKNLIIASTIDDIIKIFKDTNLAVWHERNFSYFSQHGQSNVLNINQFLPERKKTKKFVSYLEMSCKKNTVFYIDNEID